MCMLPVVALEPTSWRTERARASSWSSGWASGDNWCVCVRERERGQGNDREK